jgi:hypothetical protein
VTRLRATPTRVRLDGKRRRAARITFTLTAPARVLFVVRGPAPSCDVVGRFAVRGRAGRNRVRFAGRIGHRRLAPGTYRIVARTRAGTAARPLVVVVGSGPVELPVCANQEARPDTDSMFEALAAGFRSPSSPSTRQDASGGVLPGVKKKIRQLPEALPKPPAGGFSESSDSPALLIAIALALLTLSAATVIAYVVRYARRGLYY